MERRRSVRSQARWIVAGLAFALCAGCGSASSPGQSIRVDGGQVKASDVRRHTRDVLDRECSVQDIASVRLTLHVGDKRVTKTYRCKDRRD